MDVTALPLAAGPACGSLGTSTVFPDRVTCEACKAILPSLSGPKTKTGTPAPPGWWACKHGITRKYRCTDCEADYG